MPYKNEHEFSRSIVSKMRKQGWHVTLIESRTVPGIPDAVAIFLDTTQWIEFKMMRCDFNPKAKHYTLPFRAGQQAWARGLHRATLGNESVKCLVAFNNGIYCVPLEKMYAGGKVPIGDFIKHETA